MKLQFRYIGIVFLLLVNVSGKSQDHVLVRNIKTSDTIVIPLNDYPLYLKPHEKKRMKVIPTDFKDSTFVMRVWTYRPGFRKAAKERIKAVYQDSTLTRNQMQRMITSIQYAKIDTMHIELIEKLIIPNRYRPKMKPLLTSLEIAGSVAILGIPLGALINSFPGSMTRPVVGVAAPVATIILIAALIIFENRTFNLDKWEVVDRIPSE